MKPWERYQEPVAETQGKPWERYATSEAEVSSQTPSSGLQDDVKKFLFDASSGRLSELALRAGGKGLAAIGDIPSAMFNALGTVGEKLNSLAGMEERKLPRAPYLSQLAEEGFDALGLAQPETPTERVGSDIFGALTGTGGVARGTQALSRFAPGLGAFGENIGTQLAAAAGASGASGVARESGASPLAQFVAGLGGGLGAAGLKGAITPTAERGSAIPLLSDIEQRGVSQTSAISNVRESLQGEAKRLNEEMFGVVENGKKVKRGLFDIAKERGDKAYIERPELKTLSDRFLRISDNEIDEEAAKIYQNAAVKIQKLIEQPDKGIKSTLPTLNDIESIRRSASKLAKSGDAGKRMAGGDITRKLDNFLLNGARISGDKDAVYVWNKAINKRREYGEKFETPDAIAKALDNNNTEDIERVFIGSGEGSLNKNLARNYDDILAALQPKDRDKAGFQLRQSIVNRWVKDAVKSTEESDAVSVSRIGNAIRNFRMDNQSMWNKFPESEQKALLDLSENLRKIGKSGIVDKSTRALEKLVQLKAGRYTPGVTAELPRTLKTKKIIEVEDLLDLTKAKPKRSGGQSALGTFYGLNQTKGN